MSGESQQCFDGEVVCVRGLSDASLQRKKGQIETLQEHRMMHLSTQCIRRSQILKHLNILKHVGKGWFSRVVGRDRKLALFISSRFPVWALRCHRTFSELSAYLSYITPSSSASFLTVNVAVDPDRSVGTSLGGHHPLKTPSVHY
jgi:hypothetical protein